MAVCIAPRNPRAGPLYQCADRHMAELRSEGRLQRLLEERVIERFLKCGDPHHGFARIYCPKCGTQMHVIALIDDATVIRRILEHLGRWAPRKPRRNQRAPPADAKGIDGPKPPVQEWTYHPVPDIA